MNAENKTWLRLSKSMLRRVFVAGLIARTVKVLNIAGLALLGTGLVCWLANWQVPWVWALAATGAGCVFSILFLTWRSHTGAPGPAQGYTRLDYILGLNNALTTAAAGHGPWPPVPPDLDDRLRYQWKRIVPACVTGLGLAAAGVFLLLPAQRGLAREIPPPRSHEEISAAIAQLEQAETVQKEDLEKLRKELEELQAQSPEEWYSHSSLEAADHLQSGMQEQLRNLAQNLDKAQSSLGGMEAAAESADPNEQKRLASEFKAAMQGLKDSGLQPNEKLMSALSKLDPSALKSLDKESLQKMMSALKKAAGECKNCAGKCAGDGEAQSELESLLGDKPGNGSKPGDGPGKEGEGPGKGGVNRGPGVASLPLSDQPTQLSTDKPESLDSEDLTRTRPGDTIGTADTEHQLDKTPTGPQSAGSVNAQGKGGDAVWRENLLPQEKAVLKKYLK